MAAESCGTLIALLQIAAGLVLLSGGAEYLIRAAQTIALRAGMSPLVAGLTIVAFSTSAPELVGSLVAAIQGSPDLAIGNVVGSNIANLGLVLGIAALLAPTAVHKRVANVDTPLAFGLSILLSLFIFNGTVGRIEGGVLVALILGYTVWRVWWTDPDDLDPALAQEAEVHHTMSVGNALLVAILVASIAALSSGAYLFIEGGKCLGEILGVSERVIGLTVIALGTSLPEVATALAAARKGLSDIVVGNVIGSNIFNILSVVGFTAVAVPLRDISITAVDLTVFIGSAAFIMTVMLVGKKLGRVVGAILLVGYLTYVLLLYVRL